MNVNSHSQTFLSSTYAADNAVPTDPFILVIQNDISAHLLEQLFDGIWPY